MISFCHGQEHQASSHKHILVISSDIDHGKQLFDMQENIEFGKQVDIHIDPYECTAWIISPDFANTSVIRRLIRSIDAVLLLYSKSNIGAIEGWLDKFSVKEEKLLTLVNDFMVLELMNSFHGKLSNYSTWHKALKSIL